MRKIVFAVAAAIPLTGCVAGMAAGAVAGAAVGATSAVVGGAAKVAVKTTGAIVDVATPGDRKDDEDRKAEPR
ncbi:MAG: hypothetical protein ACOYM8_06375 [Caulobacterales bacterium]|jgi:hypothetical protein